MDNAELLDERSEDAMYIVSDLMQVSLLYFMLASGLCAVITGKSLVIHALMATTACT